MSHIATIIKKELREMLSPGSIVSVLVMVVLFAGLGGLIGGEVEKTAELPRFAIITEDSYISEYNGQTVEWDPLAYLYDAYGSKSDRIVVLSDRSDSGLIEGMKANGLTSAIVLPTAQQFADSMSKAEKMNVLQYYIYEPSGMFGSVSSTVMSTIVNLLNTDLSKKLIATGGSQEDYSFVTAPLSSGSGSINTVVNGESYNGVTPYDISNTVSSQTMMIPLVIMIIITMIGSIVISSMGSEKENKTLETLLTLPIRRTSIVTGKIVAAAIVGLIYGLAYMIGMSIYMNSMTGMISGSSIGVDLESIGMALDLSDWALVMASMFLAIVCALGICMILGAFSKNYKTAQTMTMPLSILAMIPMFVIMFTGWYGAGSALQGVCFAIPFSHPMMAMQALMNGDITLVLAGIAYMAVFALATILITVRIYSSDILVTGLGQSRLVQKLTGRRRTSNT